MTNGSLIKFESIAECSHSAILQYFWPAFSIITFLKPIFGLFFWVAFKTGFTVHCLAWIDAWTLI